MDSIILKKSGFWSREWSKSSGKYDLLLVSMQQPKNVCMAWNVPITIQGQVRLKDLLGVLAKAGSATIDTIGRLTGANLAAYLKEPLVPVRDPDRYSRLKFVEVFRYYELDNYDTIDGWELSGSVSAHGVGKPWDDDSCKDVPVEDRGCSYAIEFTPWKYLLNLPLRLQNPVYLGTTTWRKTEKRKVGFVKKNGKQSGKPLFETDRKLVKMERREIAVSYTLGEFLYGLFDELCFFHTPQRCEEESALLKKKLDDAKSAGPEDFLELKEIK